MNPNCYSDVFRFEDSFSRRRSFIPSSSSSGAKKLKCDIKHQQEEEEEDIISNLPESLLHYIFSFLDIKHAIHTCVLSKRWRYFWVSIPTLNFVCKAECIVCKPERILFFHDVRSRKKFVDFVNRVLMLRDYDSNIHKFVIAFYDDDEYSITSNLDTWIHTAVMGNVEEISLSISCPLPYRYRLPNCLFTCKSLIKLEIHGWCASWSLSGLLNKISLPRLKSLCLDSVFFNDEYLKTQIFGNCPSLESLILHSCSFGSTNLDICSLKLKELVLINCRPFNIWFNFNVPNLISFHYYNVSVMLTSGDRKKKEMYFQRMVHILKKLHNIEDLKLSAPHLDQIDCNLDSGCWEAGLSSDSDCLMMNKLTVFELREVIGCDNEVKFVEVLLKSAKVLEKLVLDFSKDVVNSPETKKQRFIFRETVLALPRSSLTSTILFK